MAASPGFLFSAYLLRAATSKNIGRRISSGMPGWDSMRAERSIPVTAAAPCCAA